MTKIRHNLGKGVHLLPRTEAQRTLELARQQARRSAVNPQSLATLPAGQTQPMPGTLPSPESTYFVQGGREGQSAGPSGLGQEPQLFHQPGGDIVEGLVHPTFGIIERLFRKLPEESFFLPSVSARKPVQFGIGSFQVPESTAFWLWDYEFSIYRPSGIDPGDTIKAAEGRFSGFMGFDITFNGRRLSDLRYELDPTPITLQREEFENFLAPSASAFTQQAANSFASTASPGLSLLPVRSQVQGARDAPFVLIAENGTDVALSCVIFRPITSPIAFVEGRMGGYLVQDQTASALVNRVRPR
jgi:hypothetical protein